MHYDTDCDSEQWRSVYSTEKFSFIFLLELLEFGDGETRRECALMYENGITAQNLSIISSSLQRMEWVGIDQFTLLT